MQPEGQLTLPMSYEEVQCFQVLVSLMYERISDRDIEECQIEMKKGMGIDFAKNVENILSRFSKNVHTLYWCVSKEGCKQKKHGTS